MLHKLKGKKLQRKIDELSKKKLNKTNVVRHTGGRELLSTTWSVNKCTCSPLTGSLVAGWLRIQPPSQQPVSQPRSQPAAGRRSCPFSTTWANGQQQQQQERWAEWGRSADCPPAPTPLRPGGIPPPLRFLHPHDTKAPRCWRSHQRTSARPTLIRT